jgi:hypothetical protein
LLDGANHWHWNATGTENIETERTLASTIINPNEAAQ